MPNFFQWSLYKILQTMVETQVMPQEMLVKTDDKSYSS